MNSIIKSIVLVGAGLVATMGSAFAVGTPIPEPGTFALVGLAGAVAFLLSKRRK